MIRRLMKLGVTLAVLACALAFALAAMPAAPEGALPDVLGDVADSLLPGGGADAGATGRDANGGEEAPVSASGDAAANAGRDGAASQGAAAGDAGAQPVYEAGAVLVSLADSVQPEEALARIAADTSLDGLAIAEATPDYVKLVFSQANSVEDAVARIEQSDAVAAVQPNFCYYPMEGEAAGAPTSPQSLAAAGGDLFAVQPQDAVIVNDPIKSWHLKDIGANEAWETLEGQDLSPVVVAVVDTTFAFPHEDFPNSSLVSPYNAATGASGVGNVSDRGSTSANFHGMQVLGIIGATANNGVGMAGIVNNHAKVMPIKTTANDGKMYTTSLVKAYEHIASYRKDSEANAKSLRVVNLSLGNAVASLDWSTEDAQVVGKIADAFEDGVVTVTAACNVGTYTLEGKSVSVKAPFYSFPGDYGPAVSVVNLTEEHALAPSSNYNRADQMTKDLAAPGTKIHSTYGLSNTSYTTDLANPNITGTSFAAPVVSGVLGLMFAQDADLTAEEAVSKLYSSATDRGNKGWDAKFGHGEVNAAKAVSGDVAYLSGPLTLLLGESAGYEVVIPSVPEGADVSIAWELQGPQEGEPALSLPDREQGAQATVTASAAGQCVLTATVTVTGSGEPKTYRATQTVSVDGIEGPSDLVIEDTRSYSVLSADAHATCTWSTSDPSIAQVNASTGAVTAKKSGNVTLTATIERAGQTDLVLTKDLAVRKVDLGKDVTVNYTRPTYTGLAVKPTMTVRRNKGASNEITLVEGVDFKATYSSNVNAGEGAGRVKLEALAASALCEGSGTYKFDINQASIAKATMGNVVAKAYTGKAVAQNPTVKAGGRTLAAGAAKDYTLSYQNSKGSAVLASAVKAAGTYYVVATGRGNYTGTVRKAFKVVAPTVTYRAHVQNKGWQKYVKNGKTAGTTRGLRMEALNLKASSSVVSGGIKYRVHVQNIGWQSWRKNGKMAGTSKRSLRVEAIQVALTGNLSKTYDVYYRVHAQGFGWMGWAKNGAKAGTAGYSFRLQGLQVKLVPKALKAPGSTKYPFRKR